VRILVARGRRLGLGRSLPRAAVALALLAVWTLASVAWSGAPWRALVEFDRALLYLLALSLFGSLALTAARGRFMMRGIAVAIGVVCLAALLARLLPGLYPLTPRLGDYGLAYPVTYANTLGLLAVLGLLLCLHLTSDPEERPLGSVLAAAAVPALAVTLLLTGSWGAALAGAVGLAVLLAAAVPRALGAAAVATLAPSALALLSAAGAGALRGSEAGSAVAVGQGREVAVVVGLSVANAALIRWLALRRSGSSPRSVRVVRGRTRALVAAGVVLAGGLAVAGGSLLGEGRAGPEASVVRPAGPESAARLDHWRVALGGFAESPLLGGGAGTYELLSQRERSVRAAVRDAHSLPLELLAELGAVGFALLATAIVLVLRGLMAGLRTANRDLFAATLAVTAAWSVHAAIDWDWEMPVVTLPVFALCGAALGALPAATDEGQDGPSSLPSAAGPRIGTAARPAVGAVLLAVVALATVVGLSQVQLRGTVAATRAGDCRAAGALASELPTSLRPEPHAMVARCELRRARASSGAERRRHAERAIAALGAAARRDPGDSTYRGGITRARRVAGSVAGR